MFNKFFLLKLFIENYDSIVEIKSLAEFNYLERNRVKSVVLPFIKYNEKEYTIGDIFINKDTKEFIVFSFYTHNESVNKLGFFSFKNFKTFELFNKVDLNDAICINYTNNHFHFEKLNEIQNLNHFEKLGNILLLNKKSLYLKFIDFFDKVNISTFGVCKKIFTKINHIHMIVHNGENPLDYISHNSLIKKEIINNNKNLKVHIQLSIIDSNQSLECLNNEILCLKNKEIENHYLIYFNTNNFSASILGDNEVNIEYLCENTSNYTSLFSFDKKTKKKYKNILLKIIADIK